MTQPKTVKAAFGDLLDAVENKAMTGLGRLQERIKAQRLAQLQKDLDELNRAPKE